MNFADAFDPIRALKSSWKMLSPAGLPLLIGGLILALTDGVGDPSAGFRTQMRDRGAFEVPPAVVFGILGCVGLWVLVAWLVNSWVSCGMATAVEKTIVAGTAEVGDVFDARGRFGAMLLTKLLVFLLYCVMFLPTLALVGLYFLLGRPDPGVGMIVLFVFVGLVNLAGAIYVSLGLSLASLACAVEGLGPTESLARSWSLARGQRLTLFVYWIVLAVVAILGLLACCIGVFFTSAFVKITPYESYLALVKPEAHATSWVVSGAARPDGWVNPPPAPPGSTNTGWNPPRPPVGPSPWSSTAGGPPPTPPAPPSNPPQSNPPPPNPPQSGPPPIV